MRQHCVCVVYTHIHDIPTLAIAILPLLPHTQTYNQQVNNYIKMYAYLQIQCRNIISNKEL